MCRGALCEEFGFLPQALQRRAILFERRLLFFKSVGVCRVLRVQPFQQAFGFKLLANNIPHQLVLAGFETQVELRFVVADAAFHFAAAL